MAAAAAVRYCWARAALAVVVWAIVASVVSGLPG
jgi:hypothetical protein